MADRVEIRRPSEILSGHLLSARITGIRDMDFSPAKSCSAERCGSDHIMYVSLGRVRLEMCQSEDTAGALVAQLQTKDTDHIALQDSSSLERCDSA